MLNNKQKRVYVLIGTAVGLIAGIYHLTLKEIIGNELMADPSRNSENLQKEIDASSTKERKKAEDEE